MGNKANGGGLSLRDGLYIFTAKTPRVLFLSMWDRYDIFLFALFALNIRALVPKGNKYSLGYKRLFVDYIKSLASWR